MIDDFTKENIDGDRSLENSVSMMKGFALFEHWVWSVNGKGKFYIDPKELYKIYRSRYPSYFTYPFFKSYVILSFGWMPPAVKYLTKGDEVILQYDCSNDGTWFDGAVMISGGKKYIKSITEAIKETGNGNGSFSTAIRNSDIVKIKFDFSKVDQNVQRDTFIQNN